MGQEKMSVQIDPTPGEESLAQEYKVSVRTQADDTKKIEDGNTLNTKEEEKSALQTAEKRKRRREAWEKAKEAGRRFELHRGLGNILRRAEDLFVEVRCFMSIGLGLCC